MPKPDDTASEEKHLDAVEEKDGQEEVGVPTKSRKNLKKAISKSLNDLQSLKQRSMPKKSKRQQSKFSRKSAKSKRTKHYNPKKKVAE